MQAFDLVPEYHVLSSPVRKAFKMIGALPFVEPGSVVEFWDVPVACRDYQPYPVDLPLSSQKRRNLDLQEESGLEDEKSSRTTEEEVERPQQPFKRSR